MTKLEAIEKIRKLPKLNDGYEYKVTTFGRVWICRPIIETVLYANFEAFVHNEYKQDLKEYSEHFAKPIYENGEIVGYE